MIYNYGSIWFYESIANRHYENAGNRNDLHFFQTNVIPSFQIVVLGVYGTANYAIRDMDGNAIQSSSCTVFNKSTSQAVDYTVIQLSGAVTSGKSDGRYYLTVSYGAEEIYSDVFCWKTDLSNYLKIVANTSAMKIGAYPMEDFTHTVYLKSVKFLEEFEINEEGEEKTYGVVPAFTSRNRIHTHQISGYNKTLNFLSGLRVAESNGTITITWAGEELEVYDIQAELNNQVNNNQYVCDLKFKLKDYLQTYNNV